ncbi:MAG: hypothetical protein KAH72_05345 [Flavobacteriaceae bacterium]|nr:hypothetical protein [Flavobacteriaceae bacterium]
MLQTAIAIKKHFPELREDLKLLPDYRDRPQYEVDELIMAVLVMFLFKRGSRNNADNTKQKINYNKNIQQIFEFRLPDLDTANGLMVKLDVQHLESIKKKIVSILLSRKVLNKYKLFDLHHNVTVDGTGVHSYEYEPYPECPYKTSKNGTKTWTAYVLEAKIVCSNGFSISITTEWVKNPVNEDFDKQDCEQKAFIRLAEKLKKDFPRLPICITADGLYPNNTVFNICKNNDWKYIITLKDGNLKSVWQEIVYFDLVGSKIENTFATMKPKIRIIEEYNGFQNIDYQEHSINVVKAIIKSKSTKTDEQLEVLKFAHVTNFELSKSNLKEISNAGRLRWKIENEGFNEQKNSGYNLKHKYSRKSFIATQNYYQCLQIAHIINQLSHKSKVIKELIKGHDTIISFEEAALSLLIVANFEANLHEFLNLKCQMRY